MNKLKKQKFSSHVIFSTKKFKKILKLKDGNYLTKDESIKLSVQIKDINDRIKFILSLVCDFSTEVSIRFCDCEEMLALNSQFRGKFYPTDVLSFPTLNPEPDSRLQYLGDILICLPVCFNQAKHARISLSDELERMIIHGIVHLKGFDHERNESAWRVMTQLEKSIKKEIIHSMGKSNWCQATILN
ncbi:rRNA maturation RNase YbeY [Fluviispira multicolorata]|uniref:Endoribonuclease YbeY n=1 Tax=Fluviispira multicolorata TaxID=2654512 RepID=A0A833N5G1_9BACT|nr:rRNA maturation RNase YbeY [Fluviispira multicolorata]KAB8027751.1 rRNA maturation RNase YbeY [Fluviispira multicolorata]